MEYFRDHKYPNGWTKSRLYEDFLTYRHFGISIAEYELHIEFVKIDQKNNEKNCTWFRDIHDRLVVSDLQFEDRDILLAITNEGFEFVQKPKIRKQMRIFISYAREDSTFAERMFDDIRLAGFDPWMDNECLLPGQKWEVGIEQAIRKSHYFIALLSSNSVAKRGYVQKEIRRALDILDQIPESDIFLIPARLDDCRPSHVVLEQLNWVDMFPDWEKGLERILKVFKAGAGSN